MSNFSKNIISKTTALFLLASLLMTSCSVSSSDDPSGGSKNAENSGNQIKTGTQNTDDTLTAPTAEYSDFDMQTEVGEDAVYIELDGTTAAFESDNVTLADGVLTISDKGDYVLSGSFSGQICVNAGADDNVHLILNGAEIEAKMAPLYFKNAKNVCVTLAEGSANSLSDSADYSFAEGEDEPNAAMFSKCDLTINGTGSIEIIGLYECGIRSKDDLRIVSGNISVQSVGDTIKGKDSLVIRNGNITVISDEDGLKSNNDEDEEIGYVIIENGTINITAGDDGIHAETWLQIYDGSITVHESYEALEGKKIDIFGGSIDLIAADDGINASSGSSEADDLMNFDHKSFDFGNLGENFANGEMPDMPENGIVPEMPENGNIPQMPDNGEPAPDGGIMPEMPSDGAMPGMQPQMGEAPTGEPGEHGEMNKDFGNDKENRDFHDENGFGGRENGDMGKNMGGGFNEAPEDGVYIKISGGTVRVQAGVDVIDSNGTFEQTGGTVITAAPSMTVCGQPDGVVDVNGDAYISGGVFISLARSAGSVDSFANVPGFICSIKTDGTTEAVIADKDGKAVFSFTPSVSSGVIFAASDLLVSGEEYTINYGDTVLSFVCTDEVTTVK